MFCDRQGLWENWFCPPRRLVLLTWAITEFHLSIRFLGCRLQNIQQTSCVEDALVLSCTFFKCTICSVFALKPVYYCYLEMVSCFGSFIAMSASALEITRLQTSRDKNLRSLTRRRNVLIIVSRAACLFCYRHEPSVWQSSNCSSIKFRVQTLANVPLSEASTGF